MNIDLDLWIWGCGFGCGFGVGPSQLIALMQKRQDKWAIYCLGGIILGTKGTF
jgi:hypothetical protein